MINVLQKLNSNRVYKAHQPCVLIYKTHNLQLQFQSFLKNTFKNSKASLQKCKYAYTCKTLHAH